MTSLSTRIAKLERLSALATEPLLVTVLLLCDDVTHATGPDGFRVDREPGEPIEAFQRRTSAAALKVATGGMFVVAQESTHLKGWKQ